MEKGRRGQEKGKGKEVIGKREGGDRKKGRGGQEGEGGDRKKKRIKWREFRK